MLILYIDWYFYLNSKMKNYKNLAEGAGIEPAKAYSAHVGFEDREGHQTPSTSVFRWDKYTY
jgi:hypothetical protein